MGTRDTRGRKLRADLTQFSDYFFRCNGNGLRGTPRKRWVSFSASGEKLVNRPRPWQARNDTERCICLRTTFMVQGNSPPVGLLHLSVLPSVEGVGHTVPVSSVSVCLKIRRILSKQKQRLLLHVKGFAAQRHEQMTYLPVR
jgi:hypothetical protein